MLCACKLPKHSLWWVLGSVLLYGSFAYALERTQFLNLLVVYGGLCCLAYTLFRAEKENGRLLLLAGIVFRLVFLWAVPNLSQDFYRFIWDGELLKYGINPYQYTPNELIQQQGLPVANAATLYTGMGELSAKHYSNYPPVNQFLFALAAWLGSGSLFGATLVMRLTIILADVGVWYLAQKLLQRFNQAAYNAFWYFLNPLVIIELTGNLHFEGVLLFFLLAALYFLAHQQWKWAALLYALSIMVKLIPLLFLPLFLKYLGIKKSVGFYTLIGFSCLLLLLPFYSPVFVGHYAQTLTLWFTNFEFNAGVYNLVKGIAVSAFEAKPWILVALYGKIAATVTLVFVLGLSFFRKNYSLPQVMVSMLLALSLYYGLSSTVHPWYLIPLLGLARFTPYRYPMVWAVVVVLSYSAYAQPHYKEQLGLVLVEYTVVFGYFLYELWRMRRGLLTKPGGGPKPFPAIWQGRP